MRIFGCAAGALLALVFAGCGSTPRHPGVAASQAPSSAPAPLERVVANDNRQAAGTLDVGTLSLYLEAREAMWHPDAGPGERMYVFAERGGLPLIPGPLVRVPAGTRVRASVHNRLADTLRVHGLHTRPASVASPLRIAPGATVAVDFEAGEPGTYFYWGALDDGDIQARAGSSTQLTGAFVVDPADGSPQDRVFVITSWFEPADSSGPEPHVPRDMFAINGLSWPHTERFAFTVGDTVRWRWVNPTVDAHPMHLHGFYFDMTSRGTALADTTYAPADVRLAVTETMMPGGTMTIAFVPERPGRWLFHCHFALHVSHFVSFARIPDPEDPLGPPQLDHGQHGMAGLVLAMDVAPRAGELAPAAPATGRGVRLHVNAVPASPGAPERLGYVVQDGPTPPAPDSVPSAPQHLVLERGEPVRITVVNNLRVPTAIHWHGIEVEDSYADGVPGFSGMGPAITPLIAPGDTFVAAFTPPRAGTFMFHSHANELFQMDAGLAAPLIVVEDREAYDASGEAIVFIGSDGLDPEGIGGSVNGSATPAPLRIASDRPTRLRLVSLNPDWRVRISLVAGGDILAWRALAKDGAELPPQQAVRGPASVPMGPGEAADFELEPGVAPAVLVVETQIADGWRIEVPVTHAPRGER